MSFVLTEVTCDAPSNGTNTNPVPNERLTAQESYTYSCLDGYVTNDTLCTVCQLNGELSVPPPVCVRKLINNLREISSTFYKKTNADLLHKNERNNSTIIIFQWP